MCLFHSNNRHFGGINKEQSMSKATEDKLNELHGVLADTFIEMVVEEEDVMEFNEDGAKSTGERRRCASPAVLNAARGFLKDNEITADISVDNSMSSLKDLLKNKPKQSRLKDAAAAAGEDLLQ